MTCLDFYELVLHASLPDTCYAGESLTHHLLWLLPHPAWLALSQKYTQGAKGTLHLGGVPQNQLLIPSHFCILHVPNNNKTTKLNKQCFPSGSPACFWKLWIVFLGHSSCFYQFTKLKMNIYSSLSQKPTDTVARKWEDSHNPFPFTVRKRTARV